MPAADPVIASIRGKLGDAVQKAETLAKALAKSAPERMLWATNWPHPTPGAPVPDDAWMLDMLLDWIPEETARNKALVDNPAHLYRF